MKKISLFLLTLTALFVGCAKNDAASVGIIGGADGPTAVFVTTYLNWFDIACIIVGVIAIIAAIIYFVKKRKQ